LYSGVTSGAVTTGPSTSDLSPLDPRLVLTQITALPQTASVHLRPGEREQEALERVYADKTIRCRDCGMDFVFSAGEQEFYASKGLVNEPQRCQSCRAVAKQNRALGIAGGGGNGGQREMHAAVCAECGGQALVPFLPRNDRPVYCSNCFDKVRTRA
jgi:CxxC-x17-CxxC domain-containing protein